MKKILCISILASSIFAQDFIVTNSNELKEALETSQENSQDDTIFLKSGNYNILNKKPFFYKSKEKNSLTLIGSDKTYISGNNNTQLINFTNNNEMSIKLDNIIFRNGNNKYNAGYIYSNQNLIINNCTFIEEKVFLNKLIFSNKNLKILNSNL